MKTLLILLLIPVIGLAQPMATAFPSLRIPTSSRGFAMGDGGIASATYNQQLFYNVAKTAFTQHYHQAAVTYMPWLSGISNDTRFVNANYVGDLTNTSAVGAGISYLNLGNVPVRDEYGGTLVNYHASEYNLMGSYALQLSDKISLGVAFHLLGMNAFLSQPKNVYSVCADLGYYQFADIGSSGKLEWGAVLSSLGPKVTIGNIATPLPTTAGIGVAYTKYNADNNNHVSVSLDATRLLNDKWNGTRFSLGAEFGFSEQFFLRGGLAYENPGKGNRSYVSLGAGYNGFISDQSWGLDVHYLVPYGVQSAVSPFQHSFGFTLHLNLGNFQ